MGLTTAFSTCRLEKSMVSLNMQVQVWHNYPSLRILHSPADTSWVKWSTEQNFEGEGWLMDQRFQAKGITQSVLVNLISWISWPVNQSSVGHRAHIFQVQPHFDHRRYARVHKAGGETYKKVSSALNGLNVHLQNFCLCNDPFLVLSFANINRLAWWFVFWLCSNVKGQNIASNGKRRGILGLLPFKHRNPTSAGWLVETAKEKPF